MATILIVDGDADAQSALALHLRQAGFETWSAMDGGTGRELLQQRTPDLVLLELALRDLPGTQLCREIRDAHSTRHVPVIVLSARGSEPDRIAAFEAGADDFVTKPFSVRELVLRIRAVLRRATSARVEPPRTRLGPIDVDVEAHRAYVDDRELPLTLLEFRLLQSLVASGGRLRRRSELLEQIWETPAGVDVRSVDTVVKRLREKLGLARGLLQTVRGIGYRLAAPARPEAVARTHPLDAGSTGRGAIPRG